MAGHGQRDDATNYDTEENVRFEDGESRGGVSPPRAPRTVRDTLASYGSRCSAIPMRDGKRLCLGHRAPPVPVGSGSRQNTAAPLVQFHYRTFLPPTSCSAPVPRLGTLILAV